MKIRIQGLDILRFFAAVSVVLYHYFFIGPLQGYWPQNQLFPITHFGDFGVDVFFVISGFVISVSAEGRSFSHFAKSRFVRIMPALLVCSLITAGTASLLPGVSVKDVFVRWITSLTLFPQLFGQELLTTVYWTLQIEVKFYILVTILIIFKVWERKKNIIIPVWLVISLCNQFFFNYKFLSDYLLTEFSGHFIAGILLYQIRKKESTSFTSLGLILSSILIWKHLSNFESWISGAYNYGFSDLGTLLFAPTIISIVYWVSYHDKISLPSKLVTALGSMSYTLYLLHADLGFFVRAFSDRYLFQKYPALQQVFTDPVIVIIAIIASLALSALVALVIEPRLKTPLQFLLRHGQYDSKSKAFRHSALSKGIPNE
ncbi:acyltransferase family protein [Paenibacillus enshidis]|uniref:Acyltransferase family protein n=1 Tax=Paenibacillus enshidis TaxID=1458439 RepID=A0ABV5AR25_9BACL